MLGHEEHEEIRQVVYEELVNVENQLSRQAGSYNYLCLVGGSPTFTHQPVGPVLRSVTHIPKT